MGISKDETWKKLGQGDARTMLKELSVYQPLITLWGNTNCSLFSYFIKEVKFIMCVHMEVSTKIWKPIREKKYFKAQDPCNKVSSGHIWSVSLLSL